MINFKNFTILFLALICYFPLQAEESESLFGIMNIDGKILVPPSFDNVDHRGLKLGEEHIVVKKDGKCGIVNEEGKLICKLEYDYASIFARPLYEVRKDGKCGFLNKKGEEVIPCIYDSYITTYNLGSYYEMEKDGMCGLVDSLNNIIIPFEYSSIRSYNRKESVSHNFSVQKAEGEMYAMTNDKGELITPFIYKEIEIIKQGGAIAEKDGKSILLSVEGKEIAPVDRRYNSDYLIDTDYFIPIKSKDADTGAKYITLYNNKGEIIKKYNGYEIYHFSGGTNEIRHNGGFTIIDTLGQAVSEIKAGSPVGRELYGLNFCNGRAVVSKGFKHGIVDIKGNVILPFEYEHLDPLLGAWNTGIHYEIRDRNFNKKLLIVDKDKKTYLKPTIYRDLFGYEPFFIKGRSAETGKECAISLDGKELTDAIYDRVASANNYMAALELDKKTGFYNVNTGAKIDPTFDKWTYPHWGKTIIVRKDGNYGLLNADCKLVFDCIYKDIEVTPQGYVIVTDKDYRSAIFDEDGKEIRPFESRTLYPFQKDLFIFID